MKILTVIGARPQFVKASAVSRAIKSYSGLSEVMIHTGQHYDDNMSGVFFKELEIPSPTISLGVGSGSHGFQTGRMLSLIEEILFDQKPDCVLVYGDTNSTLAGALAAAKLNIPVAHVEAGLRSFNRNMPEEINRVLTDHSSSILFTPTKAAFANLVNEGISSKKIFQSGDVMYDTALYFGERAEFHSKILSDFMITKKSYVLATIHRAENTDSLHNLKLICEALIRVGKSMPVVLPLHPRTKAALESFGLFEELNNSIHVLPPVGYIDMIQLEKNASIIATDSGGVQKEAYFYEVPCVTIRHETEWTELIDSEWNHLAPPTDSHSIYEAILSRQSKKGLSGNLYGDGMSSHNIINTLREMI